MSAAADRPQQAPDVGAVNGRPAARGQPLPAGAADELATQLRVAIAHEWIDHPGGAENVVNEMLTVFPDADLWSLWGLSPGREAMRVPTNSTWLGRTPLAGHKAAALPLMPLAWRTLPRRDYDVVITSTYGLAHTARFRGRVGPTLHYVHTPARYWWAPDVDARGVARAGAAPRAALRAYDRRIAKRHTHLAANSEATRDRIARCWGLDAVVIHPPVKTEFFTPGGTGDAAEPQSEPAEPCGLRDSVPTAARPPTTQRLPRDYLLGVSRWVPYKRLDLVIATAEAVGMPAVIAGSGPLEAQLRAQAAEARVPVTVVTNPSNEQLRELYRGAAALVFPVHEDFGIVPVEAMACGTPVVGPAVGGLLETVVDGVTGALVEDVSPRSLTAGLQKALACDRASATTHASRFASGRFRLEFATWVHECLAEP